MRPIGENHAVRMTLRLALYSTGLMLVFSCSTRPQSELSPAQIEHLRGNLRTPQALGVRMVDTPRGLAMTDILATSSTNRFKTGMYTARRDGARFPIVRIHINGHASLALLDTGSTGSVIDYWGAVRTGVSPVGPELRTNALQTMGGPVTAFPALAGEVDVGGWKVRRVPLGILNDARPGTLTAWLDGERVEVVLGMDVLSRMGALTVDYRNEEVTVQGAPHGNRLAGSRAIALTFRRGIPEFVAMMNGRVLHVGVDTGMDLGLWIPRTQAEALQMPELANHGRTGMGRGVGGGAPLIHAAPRTLVTEEYTFTGLPTAIGATRMGPSETPYALIGSAALYGHAVTFDFVKSTLRIK